MRTLISFLLPFLLVGCVLGPARTMTLPSTGAHRIYVGQPVTTPADVTIVEDVAGIFCPTGAGFCPETPYLVLERNGQQIVATGPSGDLWFHAGDFAAAKTAFQWLIDATGHDLKQKPDRAVQTERLHLPLVAMGTAAAVSTGQILPVYATETAHEFYELLFDDLFPLLLVPNKWLLNAGDVAADHELTWRVEPGDAAVEEWVRVSAAQWEALAGLPYWARFADQATAAGAVDILISSGACSTADAIACVVRREFAIDNAYRVYLPGRFTLTYQWNQPYVLDDGDKQSIVAHELGHVIGLTDQGGCNAGQETIMESGQIVDGGLVMCHAAPTFTDNARLFLFYQGVNNRYDAHGVFISPSSMGSTIVGDWWDQSWAEHAAQTELRVWDGNEQIYKPVCQTIDASNVGKSAGMKGLAAPPSIQRAQLPAACLSLSHGKTYQFCARPLQGKDANGAWVAGDWSCQNSLFYP